MTPTPSTLFNQSKWSLADLFPADGSPELEAAFTTLEQKAAAFESLRPKLTPEIDSEDFIEIAHQAEEMTRLEHRLYAFAQLCFTGDTQSQSAQTLVARVEQFMAELSNRTLFFSLWWKDLPEGSAARLMAISGDYRYWLEEMRHFKPHTLSEAEEKIINIKNVTGSSAINMLYDSITNRYTFKLTVDGEEKELTRGELMTFARQADPDLRAAAYQELYRVYGQDCPILGQIYQTLVRDWRNEQVRLRKFQEPIAARNLINDIPDEVINTLLDVCQKNTGIFQRFFRLKARLIGMEKLRRYDIYAPVAKSDKTYTFGDAAQMVLEFVLRVRPAPGCPGEAGLHRKPPGQRSAQGQDGRGLLPDGRARPDPLGAAQLPGASRRCGHHGPRTGARHPLAVGRPAQRVHLPRLPAAG